MPLKPNQQGKRCVRIMRSEDIFVCRIGLIRGWLATTQLSVNTFGQRSCSKSVMSLQQRFPRWLHEKPFKWSDMFGLMHHRLTLHSLSRTKTTFILFSYKIFNKYDFQKYIARSTHNSQVHNTKSKIGQNVAMISKG